MSDRTENTTITEALQTALCYHRAGKYRESESMYQHILRRNPDHPETLNLLAVMYHQVGNNAKAVELLKKAIMLSPQNPSFYSNLGVVLNADGRWKEAIRAYERALHLIPDYAEAWNNMGAVFKDHGQFDAALASFQKALHFNPDYTKALVNLGCVLKELNQPDDAIACFEKALKISPDFPEACYYLGDILKDLGKFEPAMENFRKSLVLKPDYAQAHFMIAHIKHYTYYDDDMRKMEKLVGTPGVNEERKAYLFFALGKAFENIHNYDKAFDYYSKGNRVKRASYAYSISEDKEFIKKLISAFDREFFVTYSKQVDYETGPIFIVGMPRSGTTLIEQILSCHKQVSAADELSDLRHILLETNPKLTVDIFPDQLKKLDRNDMDRFRSQYRININKYKVDGELYVTDKMPSNFLYIGMIKALFPGAKIIHCKRDPVDTCLSCYKTYFLGIQKFAYDLDELGKYYLLYEKLMSHWHHVLPGYLLDVQYEDLINDQKTQTRRLLDFCGLPWNDSCLSFHKSERTVKTASFAQVRKPLYTGSVQFWKHYTKHLGQLLTALKRDG
ncbi:MAG: tetratricopeptide repeat protein [Planctomycetes bacterium]|nr:tetratricopeptide repeat protein [Planctomycetota bacterium]